MSPLQTYLSALAAEQEAAAIAAHDTRDGELVQLHMRAMDAITDAASRLQDVADVAERWRSGALVEQPV